MAAFLAVGLLGLLGLLAHRSRSRKQPPAAGPGWTGHPSPPPYDGGPGFTIVDRHAGERTDPGFAVRDVSTGRRQKAQPGSGRTARRGPSAGAVGFSFVVSDNPTAICKLTGRPVGTCACDKHQGRGKP